jgi:hypothetical protein
MRAASRFYAPILLALVVRSSAAFPCAGDGRTGYPADWWKPVPPEDLQSWEIGPQAAGPCEVILSKRNELGILSNFAATAFTLDGERYASVEGFWQMMKFPEGPDDPRAKIPDFTWPATRAQVGLMVAFDAKHMGDVGSDAMKRLGINYVTYRGKQLIYHTPEKGEHYQTIFAAMKAKLAANPEVRRSWQRTPRCGVSSP